jgi:hypothetical protein
MTSRRAPASLLTAAAYAAMVLAAIGAFLLNWPPHLPSGSVIS